MDEHLRLEFNDWALAGRGPGMEKGHRPVGEQAIQRMSIPANAIALDVGCGSGWATRLMAESATQGKVIGIDIADEMVRVARETSSEFANVEYEVATAEALPFSDDYFTHVFSMESLYYYSNMENALREIHRTTRDGGLFATVVDLYRENEPSHQWIPTLKVPVQLLSIPEYRELLEKTGFVNIKDERLIDPTPVPENYSGGSFKTREDLLLYRQNGSLMLTAEVSK